MHNNDKEFYLRMVALWQLTTIPGLKAAIVGDTVQFFFDAPKSKLIVDVPIKIFYQLEPIEILSLLERAIQTKYFLDAKTLRSPLIGFKKDPFSSQN